MDFYTVFMRCMALALYLTAFVFGARCFIRRRRTGRRRACAVMMAGLFGVFCYTMQFLQVAAGVPWSALLHVNSATIILLYVRPRVEGEPKCSS